jgi:hypothetical protein
MKAFFILLTLICCIVIAKLIILVEDQKDALDIGAKTISACDSDCNKWFNRWVELEKQDLQRIKDSIDKSK